MKPPARISVETASDDGEPPRDFAALRELIVARREQLPRRLTQVAMFALENPDEIAFGTAASIAELCTVQPSTLVRFAQALGYQGFSDLQLVFRDRLKERVPAYQERLRALRAKSSPTAKAAALLDGFAEAAERSVRSMKQDIDLVELEKAITALSNAGKIYLIGLRRSFPVASYLAYAFGKLGVETVMLGSAAGFDSETLSFATPKDAMLAVSFAPYATATIALATDAAQRGVKVIAITDSPLSPLATVATTWLEVTEADFEGFRSASATFALAMTIAVAVAERRGS